MIDIDSINYTNVYETLLVVEAYGHLEFTLEQTPTEVVFRLFVFYCRFPSAYTRGILGLTLPRSILRNTSPLNLRSAGV